MMTRLVAVPIQPGEDGRCGKCEQQSASSETAYCHCDLFGETLQESFNYGAIRMRCSACLAHEKVLADVVEALVYANRGGVCVGDNCPTCRANQALAALEALKK